MHELKTPPPKEDSGLLPAKEKISYGLGSANDAWGNWLLPSIVWPVFNIHLGLAPSLVSLALLLNRLIDAVSDPFFGWASDNTRSPFGRRRPYILVGSVLAGIAMPLFFLFLRPGWSGNSYFWYLVFGSGILITLVSCFNMPYQSLGSELTPDYHERTSVYAYRGGIQKIAEIGNFAAAAFITAAYFKGDVLFGAKVYSLIIGVLMIAAGIAVFAGVKERYYQKVVDSGQGKVGLRETFGGALKCRPFRAQLAMALAYGTCTSMIGALGYYTTVYYVCRGDVALGSKWNLAMGASMVVIGFLGVPFFAKISRVYGKRHAMMVVQILSVLVFASTWLLYNPALPWLQLVASGLIAFTSAGFWMLYGALGADVIDYDELESGQRREGAFAACGSYLIKIGLAVGIGGSGYVLEWTGFNEVSGTQSSGLANSAGSAPLSGNDPDVATNGSGDLVFVQGTGTDPDNLFRNANLTTKNLATGTYELSYTITSATIAGGDASGANVGFGIRDDSNTDLFVVRVQRQSSALRLEYRTGSTTLLENFGVTTLSDLQVRAVFNLDTDTCDVFWKLGSNAEKSMVNLPLGGTGLEADMVRIAANTNTTDWGPTDHVDVDFLRFKSVEIPAAPTPFQKWVDAADGSVSPSADKLPLANPDGDEAVNLAEFAFGGNPFDPASGVDQHPWIGDTPADADTLDEFVVTLPVRAGCRFHPSGSGPVTATIDGLDYQIRGSLDLVDFTEPVDEVFPALESGYPPAARGWEYHSFRIPGSNGVPSKGFIQGVVETAQ